MRTLRIIRKIKKATNKENQENQENGENTYSWRHTKFSAFHEMKHVGNEEQ